MAYQAIGRGSVANDGTGDDLRAGAAKVNSNFVEIYTKLGNGTTLTSDSVVLLDTVQTLTNKSIDTQTNTITFDLSDSGKALLTGTIAQFNSVLSDANFATISGTESFANKTINASNNTLVISIDNLSDVDISTSAPTANQVLEWDGTSKFVPATINRIANVVEDLNPQLGGNLDVNGKTILSASGDIVFNPATDIDFGNNKIKYANLYSQESDLPDVSGGNYHGMVAHVHKTGALYYAHGGVCNKIVTDVSNGPVTNYIPPSPTMLFKVSTATTSGYKFTGPGVAGDVNNPTMNFYRGFTYIFDNTLFNSGSGAEPMEIKNGAGGATLGSTDGVTVPSAGVLKFVVPMEPSDTSLVYQSTATTSIVGTINII